MPVTSVYRNIFLMTNAIDLNCDMGEGLANDAELMPLISSANIACGFHAGNENTMKKTISLALENQVAIGAHPSFADKENFGRINQFLSHSELFDLVSIQLNHFQSIAKSMGAIVHHVKPHGALYNMAAQNKSMANIIALAIKSIQPNLIVYGLCNSCIISEAKALGLQTASEGFADRTYQIDGSLTPRSQANAMITNEAQSMKQVLQMLQEKTVTTNNNQIIPIAIDTICIHGDSQQAVVFAKNIQQILMKNNILIQTIAH